jgi:hypothetical protein
LSPCAATISGVIAGSDIGRSGKGMRVF